MAYVFFSYSANLVNPASHFRNLIKSFWQIKSSKDFYNVEIAWTAYSHSAVKCYFGQMSDEALTELEEGE